MSVLGFTSVFQFYVEMIIVCLFGIFIFKSLQFEHDPASMGLWGFRKASGRILNVQISTTANAGLILACLMLFSLLSTKYRLQPDEFSDYTIHLILNLVIFYFLYLVVLLPLVPLIRRFFDPGFCALLLVIPMLAINEFTVGLKLMNPSFTVCIPKKILIYMGCIWAAGFALVLLCSLLRRVIISRRIKRSAFVITDNEVLEFLEVIKDECGIVRHVGLFVSDAAIAPLTLGWVMTTKAIVIPEKSYGRNRPEDFYRGYTREELRMIFLHELCHIESFEKEAEFFLTFILALNWFNPLVWIAVKMASKDLKLSCDGIMAEQLNQKDRETYVALFLADLSLAQRLSTCYFAQEGTPKYKFFHKLAQKRIFKCAIFAALLLFICLRCFSLYGICLG